MTHTVCIVNFKGDWIVFFVTSIGEVSPPKHLIKTERAIGNPIPMP